MTQSPTISVVIPAYNAAAFVREAITSALAQTYSPLEILVIDDGSTDETSAVASGLGGIVRVIRQANRGEGGARNRGLDEARGELVAFLDADDRWLPQKLELQVRTFDDPNVVAAHTNYRNFGLHDEVHDVSGIPAAQRYAPESIACDVPIMPSSLMVRAGLPLRFPEWARAAVDVIYCLALVRHGRIALVPQPLLEYRRHARSMSSDSRFFIEAHRCLTRWLAENAGVISPEEAQAIGERWLGRLCELVERAQWQRNWQAADELQRHLRAFRSHPRVAECLRRRRWPRWMYAARDLLRGVYGARLRMPEAA